MKPSEPQSQREANQQWIGQYGLYDRLLNDEELRNSASALEDFYAEKASTNMGKLYKAVTLFQEVRRGHSVEEIQLSDIQPQNSVEQTLKEVMGILYANMNNLNRLEEADENRLREIAKRCPLDDGMGVFIARSALLKMDTLPKNYLNECELLPPPDEQRNKVAADKNEAKFSLYPNPSNGNVTLEYFLEEEEVAVVEVFDLMGKRVMNTSISGSGPWNLAIGRVSSGLYTVRLTLNGKVMFNNKLSVLK